MRLPAIDSLQRGVLVAWAPLVPLALALGGFLWVRQAALSARAARVPVGVRARESARPTSVGAPAVEAVGEPAPVPGTARGGVFDVNAGSARDGAASLPDTVAPMAAPLLDDAAGHRGPGRRHPRVLPGGAPVRGRLSSRDPSCPDPLGRDRVASLRWPRPTHSCAQPTGAMHGEARLRVSAAALPRAPRPLRGGPRHRAANRPWVGWVGRAGDGQPR